MGPGVRQDGAREMFRFNFQTAHSVIASQRVRAKRGPMTGSAEQSRALRVTLDCFVSNAPRNDGREDIRSPSRDGIRPSFASSITLSKVRGRREGRVAAAPGALRKKQLRKRKNHRYRR